MGITLFKYLPQALENVYNPTELKDNSIQAGKTGVLLSMPFCGYVTVSESMACRSRPSGKIVVRVQNSWLIVQVWDLGGGRWYKGEKTEDISSFKSRYAGGTTAQVFISEAI